MMFLAGLRGWALPRARRLAWLAYSAAPLPASTKQRLKHLAVRYAGRWMAQPERLDLLPEGGQPLLLVLLGHLREELFYAGYSEFFRDYGPVFDRFTRVVIAVRVAPFEPKLALRFCPKLEVVHLAKLTDLRQRPHMVVAFNAALAEMARELMPTLPDRIVYYCQDFEAGFVPFGTDFVTYERAVARTSNLVVSTRLLKDFLVRRGLIRDQNVYVTRPRIERFPVQPGRTRRLFFYYRPEHFNERNLSGLIDRCVQVFCARHHGFELFLVGSVAQERSYMVNGTLVRVVRKLPKQDYLDLISSCDVVVSLIYSAHPGVVAFQSAASGIPTVTNVFENRDAALLRRISSNIVPFDPVREELTDAIEVALGMAKGQPDFDEALYSGDAGASLLYFHERVLARAASPAKSELGTLRRLDVE